MDNEKTKHLNSRAMKSLNSFEKCKKYAEQGYVEAQSRLASFYADGTKEVEQDYKKAFEWYKKAAEQGGGFAELKLGEFYQFGNGVVKINYKRAFNYYKKQAKEGMYLAQYRLANLYYDGLGVEQDYAEAVYWFKKSAEQGFCVAQWWLGSCYRYGLGISRDFEKAYSWWKKSAIQSYGLAQYSLGECYRLGMGTIKDYEKAAFWYSKAIENGIKDAEKGKEICEVNIGLISYEEKIEDKISGLEKYIEEQDVDALYECAILLAETEPGMALKAYRKGAELGDARAQYMLGHSYFTGCVIEQNYKEAYKWFEKSAEQNYAEAQYLLGWLYYEGKGVEKNSAKAEEWFLKAVDNGGFAYFKNYPGITWQEKLRQRIKASGDRETEIFKKAHISKQTAEKIRNGKTNTIKKETVLALAIGFGYDINEAVQFLSEMGYAFSQIEAVDNVVVGFIFEKNYNIDDINAELDKNNLPLLGDERNA